LGGDYGFLNHGSYLAFKNVLGDRSHLNKIKSLRAAKNQRLRAKQLSKDGKLDGL
jgi:hypothetical protein